MLAFLKGFSAFLSFRYWVNPYPVPLGPSLAGGILAFFGWFLVLAVILFVVARGLKKKDRLKYEVIRRFGWLLFATGTWGLIELFLAYEQIPVLGMRLGFLIIFIYFVVKLVLVTIYAVREYPVKRDAATEKARREKWLPTAKK
jgi:hypothetical protein